MSIEYEGQTGNILVISPHPDDETLGCGGTLLKYASQGVKLHWLLVTACDENEYSTDAIRTQETQVKQVKEAYPFKKLHWLKYPTTRLEETPITTPIEAFSSIADEVKPEIVFIPWAHDVHSDHRLVAEASASAFKSFYMSRYGIRKILAYETLSETEASFQFRETTFTPNVFEDISTTIDRKIELFRMYQTEVQPEPMPRSESGIKALARYRGATINCKYAEAFILLREISK
ncbi:MAG: PIG-L family deacetylase [Planctomycetota bacterium]|nr:MAG: PIG-L family deacetylase [Planctomycetota bacterium]